MDLVQSDTGTFQLPQAVNGIVSTFALTLVPEYADVIHRASEALVRGRRFVILDFKVPDNWLARLAPLFVLATSPFGVSLDLANRHPWEAPRKYFSDVYFAELYGGFACLAAGEFFRSPNPADASLENGGFSVRPNSSTMRSPTQIGGFSEGWNGGQGRNRTAKGH